jgi:2-keto-3-deoxy-L-rhamnonate aldolase RhmA
MLWLRGNMSVDICAKTDRSRRGGRRPIDLYCRSYAEKTNEVLLLAIQIESRTAIENAEEIFSVPGVDAFFIGPDDGLAAFVDDLIDLGISYRIFTDEFAQTKNSLAARDINLESHGSMNAIDIAYIIPYF